MKRNFDQPLPLSYKAYYNLRPIIPRSLQLYLRRKVIQYKKSEIGHRWPIDPDAAAKPANWSGWPDGKQFALVLMHDVDTAAGYNKCTQLLDLEKRLGFKSTFSFVPERYGSIEKALRDEIKDRGFGLAIHGLKHDGKLFRTYEIFLQRAERINRYLREWGSTGFTSPAMHHNLSWMHHLDISFSVSTFDTDPFEPQSDGIGTIFPISIKDKDGHAISMELPYTMPQDFTLFVLMQEKSFDIWVKKLNWVAGCGGMVLLNTHPDYMCFNGRCGREEYPVNLYEDFLMYVKRNYANQYWMALAEEVADYRMNAQIQKINYHLSASG
jgi:hypothetical protein